MTLPPPAPFQHLEPGRQYEVVQPFVDFDNRDHPAGERWTFLTYSFLPYDDGLSLFVRIDRRDEQVRLRWTKDDQAPIIDGLENHVRRLDG